MTQTDTITTGDQLVIVKASDDDFRSLPYSDLLTSLETDLVSTASAVGPRTLNNLSIGASISGNALTLTLNQGDGITAPSSTSNSSVSFETINTDAGSYSNVAVTSRLTITIPSGATLGMANATLDQIHVYLINNSGSVELAVSVENLWDEGLLWATTAISAASASRTTLYSNVARTSMPIRLVARVNLTEAVAGTYATMPNPVESVMGVRSGVIANTTASGSPTSLTTNTPINIASITLPPGIWDINAGYGFIPTGTTSTTDLVGAVSLVSATLPATTLICNLPALTDPSFRDRIQHISPTVWVSTQPITKTVPEYRHISNASKTVYLVIQATFTVSTLTGFGWIQARKVS